MVLKINKNIIVFFLFEKLISGYFPRNKDGNKWMFRNQFHWQIWKKGNYILKKSFYMIYFVFYHKNRKILINNSEKRIEYLRSDPEEYYIFSDILEFKKLSEIFIIIPFVFKRQYSNKNSNVKYYFYNFDKEWFLKNKQKILSYITCSYSRKSLPEIFQEIEMEKKWMFQNLFYW